MPPDGCDHSPRRKVSVKQDSDQNPIKGGIDTKASECIGKMSGYTLGGGSKSNVDLSAARTQYLQNQLQKAEERHSRYEE